MTTATTESPIELNTESATPAPKDPQNGFWWGTGRRKTSVARVRIKVGTGRFLINGRQIDEFFTEPQYRNSVVAPLKATDLEGKLDVYVKVHGGGTTGQAGAIMVGLGRALKDYDPTHDESLRRGGHLTIDSRQVERKKYGQAGARRRFQFSKR